MKEHSLFFSLKVDNFQVWYLNNLVTCEFMQKNHEIYFLIIFSSEPSHKEGFARFTTVPLKVLSGQIAIFLFLETVYFYLLFLYKSDLRISCIQESMEKLADLNTFLARKRTSSVFLSDQDLKGTVVNCALSCLREVHFKFRVQSL